MVTDYNKYMLGVDKFDQLVSYYSFLHKSIKWWRKVFFLVAGGVGGQFLCYLQRGLPEKQNQTHATFGSPMYTCS